MQTFIKAVNNSSYEVEIENDITVSKGDIIFRECCLEVLGNFINVNKDFKVIFVKIQYGIIPNDFFKEVGDTK